MKSLFDFIVEPIGQRYNNKVKVGDKSLIINTQLETFKSVNNIAKVIQVPKIYKTSIKVGDLIMIHHNVFRRWYNVRGEEKNSKAYFKDNLYFVTPEQIYMYNGKAHLNYCFIKPVLNKDYLRNRKEQPNVGIVKYSNSSLESIGIIPETLITFTPNSEFEFIIDGERLYCMKSNDIALTHEYQGNEKENNPSWAKGS